jgi:hypothetical protein
MKRLKIIDIVKTAGSFLCLIVCCPCVLCFVLAECAHMAAFARLVPGDVLASNGMLVIAKYVDGSMLMYSTHICGAMIFSWRLENTYCADLSVQYHLHHRVMVFQDLVAQNKDPKLRGALWLAQRIIQRAWRRHRALYLDS